VTTYDELLDELRGMNIVDDDALINWFYRTFKKASDEEVAELPNREEMAYVIGMERRMLPNPDLPEHPLNGGAKGGAAFAAWLIQRGLNLTITAPTPDAPLSLAYWYYAETARDYLGLR
jgi:hypothetical protein